MKQGVMILKKLEQNLYYNFSAITHYKLWKLNLEIH